MLKYIVLLLTFSFCVVSAQKDLAFDSLKLKDVKDIFADDYGNIYLYKDRDFSLTKFDSLGKQKGKLMLTLPFKIQSVQNPMNIPSFSENTQELKFFDQNLNEIQRVNFRQKFSFIKVAYVEDLQQVWLLDESSKNLFQYNYRDDLIINSYLLYFDVDRIVDMIVFENTLYFLSEDKFSIYNFKTQQLQDYKIEKGKKLRRENDSILVIAQSSILKFLKSNELQPIFEGENSKIVDKNSASFFELKGNKLYLYPTEKK